MDEQREILAELQPDPLAALAVEYHQRTEAYDRSVCTGPIRDDGIMPATNEERRSINGNALRVRAEMLERAVELGFTERHLQKAIVHYRPRRTA
jgi:hypothetical protein